MTFNLPGSVEDANSIKLALRSWKEVDEYLKICKGIILPLGSTEQHGPTGAIGTDFITAEAISLEVGRRTGVLVSPTQVFGMAQHHLGFAGTMSLQPSTLLEVLKDLIFSLARHGFEKVFVINGHGGNIATTKAAFSQVYNQLENKEIFNNSRLTCKLVNWFMNPSVFAEAKSLYGDKEGQHATPSEISLTLFVEPSLISKQHPLPEPPSVGPIKGPTDFRKRYPDGRMGSDPYLAKSEHGAIFLEKAAQALTKELTDFINSP